MELPKDLMQIDMKRMDFVQWDRFVFNREIGTVDLFGWIARKDMRRDFVLLTYEKGLSRSWTTKYNTSSAKYSKEIYRILECEGGHIDCTKVKSHFDIKNVER